MPMYMNQLYIEPAVVKELAEKYNFSIPKAEETFFDISRRDQVTWCVFPNAQWITVFPNPNTRHSSRLSVEHVLALQLMPNEAWDDYLKAEFPNHKE